MPDGLAQLAAALLPRYRVERELGVGGMATVYLAHDVKHDRDVAIKVLKRELAAAVGSERFLGEIRTAAHLRHPHILPLFDSGVADGLPFYVMPFVDGESLRTRLRRQGQLPIAETVAILRELGDALACAHASGVVHRDVKPDNILISGRHVFLADFGVARAVAAQTTGDRTRTVTGVMIGTPGYMAPEQVTAGPVDRRSDIYAFGVTAYELLTGAPPFTGSPQDVVTAHLTQLPVPVATLRQDTPAALASAVMRCLEKKPDERWQRVEDMLPALAGERAVDVTTAARGRTLPRRRWPLVAAGLVLAMAAVTGWYLFKGNRSRDSLTVGKMMRVTTEPGLELDPALSPDRQAIAYAAGIPGHMRIYVRQISGGRILPVTEGDIDGGQRWPQWSPDGASLVFQSGRSRTLTRSPEGTGALFIVPALGGAPRRLTGVLPQGVALSPSWARDGNEIAFGASDGLYLISPDGSGSPRLIAPAQEVHSPAWSPDSRRVAFVSRGSGFAFGEESLGNVSTSTLFVTDVESKQTKRVTNGEWLDVSPVWMPDGGSLLLLSNRGGGRDVFRQRFSSDGRPDGEPQRITSGLNAHGISVSRDGRLLAYSSYAPRANIWSVAIPADGVTSVREAQQVTFGSEKIEKLAVSADGRWLAYDSDRNGQADIWKMPVGGGTAEQVTRGPNNKFVNDWSPDGQELVYHSMREGGQRDVLVVSADGITTTPVAASPAEEQHSAWGPDGNSIIFDLSTAATPINQLYVVRRAKRGDSWGGAQRLTSDGSSDPKWAPDGRLIAYCVQGQLRVIAPDGTHQRTLVSAASAPGAPTPAYAIWSRDSRTIYYKAYDDRLQTSIWSVAADGGQPRLLVRFDDPSRRSLRREFASDGQRFYFTIASDESDISAIELISK